MQVQVRESTEVFVYKARNISFGGMFIDAPVPPDAGTRISLTFRLPGLGSVDCAATVRWNTHAGAVSVPHPGFGVAFDDLEQQSRDMLTTWLSLDEPTT